MSFNRDYLLRHLGRSPLEGKVVEGTMDIHAPKGGVSAFDPLSLSWERYYRGGDWTLSGSEIDTWTDLSGNARHATGAATAGNKPVTATRASQDAVLFSGAGAYFTLPTLSAISTAGVGFLWAVLECNSDPQLATSQSGCWTLGSHGNTEYIAIAGSGINYLGPFSTTRPNTGDVIAAQDTPHTMMILSAASDFEIWVDNSSHYSSGTNSVGVAGTPRLGFDGVNKFFRGWMWEVGFLDSEPTSDVRANLQAYAVARYGI